MYGEKLSRRDFLRRMLGMGGVTMVALVVAACGGGDDDDDGGEDD